MKTALAWIGGAVVLVLVLWAVDRAVWCALNARDLKRRFGRQ